MSSGFTDITGATLSTYDIPSGLSTTSYYVRIANSNSSSVNCTASSNVLTVTVNSIAATISGTQTICYGGDPVAFTESTTSVVGSSLSYQWQSSLNNSTWADIVGATSATYDVPSGLTATTYSVSYTHLTLPTIYSV